jgi:hypothetical protein
MWSNIRITALSKQSKGENGGKYTNARDSSVLPRTETPIEFSVNRE